MMYMPDCLKATMDLLEAPSPIWNITAISTLAQWAFDVKTLADSIKEI